MLSPTINSKKPTLRSQSLSKVVTDNLDAIHKADEAFTENKNSRNLGDNKYITCDTVYHKQMNTRNQPKSQVKTKKFL